MPLILAQGLPDWQRDTLPLTPSGTLINLPAGTALNAQTTFGPFLVSGYQSLILTGWGPNALGFGVQLVVEWWTEKALTNRIANYPYVTRSQLFTSSIQDAIPVLAPWVRFIATPSAALNLSTSRVTAIPTKAIGADLHGRNSVSPIFQQAIAAGAVAQGQPGIFTPGTWQVTTVVGNAYAAAGVAAIPFTLEIDEMDSAGGLTPLVIITQDAVVPANRQGRTDVVKLSQAATLWSLKNDSAGVQNFTVNALPMGQN